MSVLGADDSGESNLIYIWSILTKPSGASNPTFSVNSSHAASTTIVTFNKAGTYHVAVQIRDSGNLSVTSTVTSTVNQILTTVTISPSSATVATTSTQQFTATSSDQFSQGISGIIFDWFLLSGGAGGTIDSSGLYTAPASIGSDTVRAASGGIHGDATVAVTAALSTTCASEPMRATGTTYYYCDCGSGADPNCIVGNDASDGLTSSTPKRTGYKVQFTTMDAGSTVALCRGGSFPGDTNNTANTNCQVNNTCDMRDYTDPRFTLSGGERRPIISGGHIGVAYSGSSPASHGFRFFNLQAANSFTGQGDFLSSDNMTDVDICNIYFHDSDLGIYWTDPSTARWTLRQSQFERMSGGILGGCTDCIVDNNYFANTSYTPNSNRDHPLYISGASVSRMKITNNEIHGCPPGVTAGTVLLVVHGQHDHLLIENNLVQCDNPDGMQDAGYYGISLDNGNYTNSVPGYEQYTTIRRNRVVNNGEYGIALSQAPYSVVEDNTIILPPSSNGYTGIITGHDPDRGSPNNDPGNTNITIRNNTIYSSAGAPDTGITVGQEGNNYIVTGNAIYLTSGGTCFNFPLSAGSYQYLSNNACNGTWGTTYDSNRVTLTSSPFLAVGTDFTPAAGSPLIGAASTASNCTVGGSPNQSCTSPFAISEAIWNPLVATTPTRIFSPTDIGAYEHVNQLPSDPPTITVAATSSSATVTGTTSTISVRATDDGGLSNLTYTWSVTSKPDGASDPVFSVNGSINASTTVATYSKSGTYQLLATVTDSGSHSTTSGVTVTVAQTLASIVVSPSSPSVVVSSTQQFTATSTDQFALGMPSTTIYLWSLGVGGAGGTIETTSGLYTAPGSVGSGSDIVSAVSASVTGTTSLTVVSSQTAATPAFSPVSGAVTTSTIVTISTASTGCGSYIYHNFTGNPTSGDIRSTTISITTAETLYAKVIGCPGYSDSAVGSASYTISVSADIGFLDGVAYNGTYAADSAVNLGQEWFPTVNGSVVALRLYVPATMSTAQRTLGLYDATGATLLGQANLTPVPSSPGWQVANLGTPITVTANTHYWVVAWEPDGYVKSGGQPSDNNGHDGRIQGYWTNAEAYL